jgi:hypothetical protein
MWFKKKTLLWGVPATVSKITDIIPEPKFKIGDVVVIGILQEIIQYAQWNIKRKEWFYRVGKKEMFRESDIIYKLK